MGEFRRPVDEPDARSIALAALEAVNDENDLVLFEDATQERCFGWVFRYNSRRFRDTGEPSHQVPGCGPLIVDRATGETRFLPTFRPPELLIAEYESQWLARWQRS